MTQERQREIQASLFKMLGQDDKKPEPRTNDKPSASESTVAKGIPVNGTGPRGSEATVAVGVPVNGSTVQGPTSKAEPIVEVGVPLGRDPRDSA